MSEITHGYFVYLSGPGPLRHLPIAWFAYIEDANEYVSTHGSEDYPCRIEKVMQ